MIPDKAYMKIFRISNNTLKRISSGCFDTMRLSMLKSPGSAWMQVRRCWVWRASQAYRSCKSSLEKLNKRAILSAIYLLVRLAAPTSLINNTQSQAKL